MIIGVGNDIVEVTRMRHELDTARVAFRDQVFSPAEITYCEEKRYPARHYAARFAAKEAFFKALGTGRGNGLGWRDAVVCHDAQGKPGLVLSGEALRLSRERGINRVFLSLSHTAELAMASVILEGEPAPMTNEVPPE